MTNMNFFAVDLGATSGRTILGSIVDGKLEQRELTRFPKLLRWVAISFGIFMHFTMK